MADINSAYEKLYQDNEAFKEFNEKAKVGAGMKLVNGVNAAYEEFVKGIVAEGRKTNPNVPGFEERILQVYGIQGAEVIKLAYLFFVGGYTHPDNR